MDPVTLIVTALAAGTTSALTEEATDAVKNAYKQLITLVKKRFADRSKAELVLSEYETAPQTWREPLAVELSAAGAEADADLLQAAQALMQLVDEAGARSGKYSVSMTNSQGVQIGDRNTQTNNFGPSAA